MEAVLQCGFESSKMIWQVDTVGNVDSVASADLTINDDKYTTSKIHQQDCIKTDYIY